MSFHIFVYYNSIFLKVLYSNTLPYRKSNDLEPMSSKYNTDRLQSSIFDTRTLLSASATTDSTNPSASSTHPSVSPGHQSAIQTHQPDPYRPTIPCKYFLNSRCKHGVSGKECKFKHQKTCRRWLNYGNHKKYGCTLREKCENFHPNFVGVV